MNCFFHDDKPAVIACAKCGVGLCRNCMNEAAYTYDSKPLCLNCSKPLAHEELAEAQKSRTWSLVKFIFSGFFIGIGLLALAGGAELMQVWIISGIAGIPGAFKATRRTREQRIMDEVHDRYEKDMINLMFGWMMRLLLKIVLMIVLAPIYAVFTCISNLIKFLKSRKKIEEAQTALNYIDQCLYGGEELLQEEPAFEMPALPNEAMQQTTLIQPSAPSQTQSSFANTQTTQPPLSSVNTPLSQSSMVEKKSNSKVVGVVIVLLLLIGLVSGYFVWYVPYAKDRDAPRTYVVANSVFFRSSQLGGVEYNILGRAAYGSEVITYSKHGEWAEVKVNGQEGFISSAYLLDSPDFTLLNGVWGDNDAKECIESSKCRLAILDYYKNNRLPSGTNGWQIYTRMKDQKPNTVFYPRIYNKNSKFTDFVFILKNAQEGGKRMIICYSFEDETEKPIFRFSSWGPIDGYIQNILPTRDGVSIVFDTGIRTKVEIQ